MNYEIFKKEWSDMMVYTTIDFDVEQAVNDFYTDYKLVLKKVDSEISVEHWCIDWFAECDLDTHPYMLKKKALETHHGNSFKRMINKFRKGTNEPQIPLIDEHLENKTP